MKSFLDQCPGYCGQIARLIDASLPESLPAISLSAAVSFCSTLKCGRIISPEGIEPNIYTYILSETGIGKGRAQTALRAIIEQCGLSFEIGEPSSDSGLLKALNKLPRCLLIWDEFGLALEELSKASQGCRATILKETMKLFSTAGEKYIGREKATEDRIDIRAPYLTIFGATTPVRFYSALDSKFVHDGFIGRWLAFEQVYNPSGVRQSQGPLIVPEPLKDYVHSIESWIPANGTLGSIVAVKKVVATYNHEFGHKMHGLSFDQLIKKAKTAFDRAFYQRGFELYSKLCLIFSDADIVSDEVTDYSAELVKFVIANQIALCQENLRENDKKILRRNFLSSITKEWISLSDITRKNQNLGLSRFERRQLIEDFIESGLWETEVTTSPNSRKKTTLYRFAK